MIRDSRVGHIRFRGPGLYSVHTEGGPKVWNPVEKALAVVVCKLDREALEAVWRFVRAQHDKIVLIIQAKPLF